MHYAPLLVTLWAAAEMVQRLLAAGRRLWYIKFRLALSSLSLNMGAPANMLAAPQATSSTTLRHKLNILRPVHSPAPTAEMLSRLATLSHQPLSHF